MNLLSMFSFMLATAFLLGAVYCDTRKRKESLNRLSCFVLLFLGWWSYSNGFFFAAETEEIAFLWHRLSSIGWVGFVAATAYYFFALTGKEHILRGVVRKLLFFALPVILLAYNLTAGETSLAVGLTRSVIGEEWAYINSPSNIWLWIYLAYVCLYFGYSYKLLLQWSSEVKHQMKRKMAVAFVALDSITIFVGTLFDVAFPLTTPVFPSVANLATGIFGVGYFFFIIHFDIFNVFHVVSDRNVIESSVEPLLVVDERGEILFCNAATGKLLETDRDGLAGKSLSSFFRNGSEENGVIDIINRGENISDMEACICTEKNRERQVLLSAAVILNKQEDYLGTVVSIRDVTQLNMLKNLYMKKSHEYQQLAYFDALTGLPNRRSIFEELSKWAAEYEKTGKDFFILYLDVDHFKDVNDEYGHEIGDKFLVAVTKRLQECIGERIRFLGRLGGDEFIMLGKAEGEESIKDISREINDRFKDELTVDDIKIAGDVTVGVSLYAEFNSINEAIQRADEEMYLRKNARGEKRSTIRHR